jgi:hypothetical protein
MPAKVVVGWLAVLLLPLMALAQSDPGINSARSHALAGVGMTLDGIDALYSNPAGLTGLTATTLHAGSAQSFGLSALTQANAAAALKTGENSVLFIRAGQFGFDAYNERQFSVGYAMQLAEQLSAALRFDAYQFSIEGYGSAMLPSFLAGIQYRLGSSLRFGAAVRNPVVFSTHDAITLPTVLSVGGSYHPSEDVGIYLELEKDVDFSPRIKLAVEYRIADPLTIRAGTAGNPGTFHAGIGLNVRENFRIDVAAGYHVQLGFTPAISLAFAAP